MTMPQAQEPGAEGQRIEPKHLLNARAQRISMLTEENDMLVAFNHQILEQLGLMEDEIERLKSSKERDGAEPPAAEGTPNPSPVGSEPRSNGRGGPSPADLARQRRAQGGR